MLDKGGSPSETLSIGMDRYQTNDADGSIGTVPSDPDRHRSET
jgi:hypothetical protein